MKIQFLGASGEVTGSCYYLEHGNTRFLVDCGMFQGHDETQEKNAAPWPFDPSSLDFVLLTHAHFDHSGRLPKLYHDGFRGKIYTTSQTAELSQFILADAADIQFHEARIHHTQPLYSLNEVKALNGLYHPVYYGKKVQLTDDISATFHDAGHILGSAFIELMVEGKVVVFSGDLGNDPVPLMNAPETLENADIVFVESTYGDRIHEHYDRVAALKQAVLDVVQKKGTLLIPAFAVERTQEILYHFNNLKETKEIPDIPVFVDSPLAIEITGVFMRNLQLFDKETQEHIQHGDDIFSFPHLKYTTTTEESKAIRYTPSPKVIIAGSGMMNGGRILHHIMDYGSYANTILCIVGFQVPGTMGRRLQDGEHHVNILHREVEIHAEVRTISAFSAHADQKQLLDWVGHFKAPKKIFVVHGEEEPRHILADKIKATHPVTTLVYPEYLESTEL